MKADVMILRPIGEEDIKFTLPNGDTWEVMFNALQEAGFEGRMYLQEGEEYWEEAFGLRQGVYLDNPNDMFYHWRAWSRSKKYWVEGHDCCQEAAQKAYEEACK